MNEQIARAVGEIRAFEEKLTKLTSHIRKENPKLSSKDALEEKLFLGTPDVEFTGKITAVDGGILANELHALDLFLIRSVAASFSYENGRLCGHSFYPAAFPEPEATTEYALDSHESNWLKNIKRLNSEIKCATGAVKKETPAVLFLDGSIIPQVADKPAANSKVYAHYEELVGNYLELFRLCESQGVMLAGIIKDSRGKHFLSLVEKEMALPPGEADLLTKTNDTAFLFSLLQEKERTLAFQYATFSDHPILKDFKGFAEKVCSFYLKPVKYDRPLRVDFLLPKNQEIGAYVQTLSSLVYSLSKHNRQYAYPAVLIEADLRAAMDPQELDRVYDTYFAQAGMSASTFKLRRNSRPFR